MTTFVPDQPTKAQAVPFFEDAKESDGWQGQATGKSVETLKSEITIAISRLGGMVVGFQKGTFLMDGINREGFRIHCTIEGKNGKLIPAKIEIASLPVKDYTRGGYSSKEKRQENSLKMALFMFRDAMRGQWFMKQLSPGYSPLMPFVMGNKEHTISQLWDEEQLGHLLTDGSETIEAEFKEHEEK